MGFPQLLIRKMDVNNFELFHKTSEDTPTVAGTGFTPSDGFYDMDASLFQFKEFSGRINAGAGRFQYKWTDVKVQIGTGGTIESFSNKAALKNRLNEIGFPKTVSDGSGVYFEAGTDISITGDGSELSPYVISYTGSGGGSDEDEQVWTVLDEASFTSVEVADGKRVIDVHVNSTWVSRKNNPYGRWEQTGSTFDLYFDVFVDDLIILTVQ